MCATTAHALSGASPAHHDPPRAHVRPPRRTCDERVACAPSRQHRGNAAAACMDKRASQRPRGSTQIVGSSQQSGGVRWPPVVAGTQAEVRSGEGKGGGSPARAGRCALRCGRCGGRKEPSPRCVGRGSALPGPLLWRRSSAPGAPGGGGRGAPPRARPARGSAAPGRLGAERRSRLRSRSPESEVRGIWGARSSGRCAPFTSAPVAGTSDAPSAAGGGVAAAAAAPTQRASAEHMAVARPSPLVSCSPSGPR